MKTKLIKTPRQTPRVPDGATDAWLARSSAIWVLLNSLSDLLVRLADKRRDELDPGFRTIG